MLDVIALHYKLTRSNLALAINTHFMQTLNSTLVEKENLQIQSFYPLEVLKSSEDVNNRNGDLHKAMLLGNSYHYKVRIVFETIEGTKSVETTVWFATEKFIMLKGGSVIPVRCIKRVIF